MSIIQTSIVNAHNKRYLSLFIDLTNRPELKSFRDKISSAMITITKQYDGFWHSPLRSFLIPMEYMDKIENIKEDLEKKIPVIRPYRNNEEDIREETERQQRLVQKFLKNHEIDTLNNKEKKPKKILIVGDAGVGKSVLYKKHKTGSFEPRYIATMGLEINPLFFNNEPSTTMIWEVGRNMKHNIHMWGPDLENSFTPVFRTAINNVDIVIIMFDVTVTSTYDHVKDWYNMIKKECGDIPVVICGNKVDCTRKVLPTDITFHKQHKLKYYDISTKTGFNCDKLWQYVLA